MNPRLNAAAITKLYDQDYYHGKGFDPLANYLSEEPMITEDLSPAVVVRTLQQKVGPSGRLLDFGSGSGRLVREALQAGYQVDGYEPSSFAAGHASEKGFKIYTEAQAILATTSISVTAIEVLSIAHRPRSAANHLSRPRPGGWFIYSTGKFRQILSPLAPRSAPASDCPIIPKVIFIFSYVSHAGVF